MTEDKAVAVDMFLYLLDLLGGAIVSLPLVLICLLLWDRERFCRRWLWMVMLVLYLNAMYITIGVPNFQYITWDPTLNLIPFQDFSHSNIIGMILNIVMFAPLGFLLPAYFERYRQWHRTLAAGLITSLLVEMIQLFTFRATDVDDLLMNTLGAVVGFLAAKLVLRLRSTISQRWKDLWLLVAINGIVILVIVFIRYPMMEKLLALLHYE